MRRLAFAAILALAAPARADEAALNARFDADIHAWDLSAWMQRMASEPNQVGGPHDKDNGEFELAQFKAWGWDAHIEEFQILYPTPTSESLELIGPTRFTATLTEPPIPGDQSALHTQPGLPAYVAYQGYG